MQDRDEFWRPQKSIIQSASLLTYSDGIQFWSYICYPQDFPKDLYFRTSSSFFSSGLLEPSSNVLGLRRTRAIILNSKGGNTFPFLPASTAVAAWAGSFFGSLRLIKGSPGVFTWSLKLVTQTQGCKHALRR